MKTTIILHIFSDSKNTNYSLLFDVEGEELDGSSRIPGTDLTRPLFYQYKLGNILLSMLNSDNIFYLSENETQFLTENEMQMLFGEEWKPNLNMFKYLMGVQCEPHKLPENYIIGDVSDCFSSTANIGIDENGINYKFGSLLDFLKYEYAELFSRGIRFCECDYCRRYYKRVNINQRCCGDTKCKKRKNSVIRKKRENTPLSKARRNAVDRITKKYGNDSEEYRSFLDEFDKNKSALLEPELIEWCNNQYRVRATRKFNKSSTSPSKK